MFAQNVRLPVAIETRTSKIEARLKREGWVNTGGSKHDIYRHESRAGRIVVPRHREQSIGVARGIAEVAGWLEEKQ
jgi:predicted RNA binding protein YcfA (HicA-like mRNA interferase family)